MYLILSVISLVSGLCCHGAIAQNEESTGSPKFMRFCENIAGRYSFSDEFETVVIELIPAFGRLFAATAYYMNGESLYSYYASELTPACSESTGNCSNDNEDSFLLNVRSYSNMSYAGNYWPGDPIQRITRTAEGIFLSDFEGDSNPLFTDQNTLLLQDDSAPSIFIYKPESSSLPDRFRFAFMIPPALTGNWIPTEPPVNSAGPVGVSFQEDKSIMLLTAPAADESETPAGLYAGTYTLLNTRTDEYVLCAFMSRPDSGGMPYESCALLHIDGDKELTVSRLPEYDCLLLPESEESMKYMPLL